MKVLWVCLGRRYNEPDKRLYQTWRCITASDKLDDQQHAFTKPIVRGALGGVYEVSFNDNRVSTGGPDRPKFMRRWHDEAAIAEWEALESAADGEHGTAVTEKKALEKSAMLDALKPIAAAYARTNVVGRRVLLAQVIETIVSGRRWL